MSLMEHLSDLRKRLVRALLAVAVGFFVCYPVSSRMLRILMDPMLDVLNQSHFIYTKLPEAFIAEMKISFVAGLFLVSPYVFHQVWKFVSPGLYAHERKWIVPIAAASAVCFVAGSLFGYFVVFPFGFSFFASYSSDVLQFMPNLGEFLDFALKILIAFGVIFELPLFMFFMARLGLVSSKALRRWRKYAILVAFIVGAILTPPDAISQTLMAVPLCLLYELGIWLAFFFGKERDPKAEQAKAEAQAEAKPAG
jgi:sec-independent protein translocase protein TatC